MCNFLKKEYRERGDKYFLTGGIQVLLLLLFHSMYCSASLFCPVHTVAEEEKFTLFYLKTLFTCCAFDFSLSKLILYNQLVIGIFLEKDLAAVVVCIYFSLS